MGFEEKLACYVSVIIFVDSFAVLQALLYSPSSSLSHSKSLKTIIFLPLYFCLFQNAV